MRARYAGVCSRTGKRYPAGTEIEKDNGGWAIAGGSGNQPVRKSDFRYVRVDGEIQSKDIGIIEYCRCVKEQPGFDVKDQSTYSQACRLQRHEDDITCPQCGRTLHILSENELWQEVTLPRLHFYTNEAGYVELSEKVGPARWEQIKAHFRYVNTREEAEAADEMDNFNEAEALERMPSFWGFFGSPADLVSVEEVLGILPENRRAALDAKEAEERRIEEEKAQIRRAARNRLEAAFPRSQGEYIPRSETFDGALEGVTIEHPAGGRNIYGGGEWFVLDASGRHAWRITNNGMDGDDWSRNNIMTGGAGAVGHRYDLTDERFEALKAFAPDLVRFEVQPEPAANEVEVRLNQEALAGWEKRVQEDGEIYASRIILAMADREPTYGGEHTERARRIVSLVGLETLEEIARRETWLMQSRQECIAGYTGDALKTAENHQIPYIILTPDPAGTAYPGRDYEAILRERGLVTSEDYVRGGRVYLHPDGHRLMDVVSHRSQVSRFVDVSDITLADLDRVKGQREEKQQANRLAQQLRTLQGYAKKFPFTITAILGRQRLDQAEKSMGRGGSETTLEKLTVTVSLPVTAGEADAGETTSAEKTLYLVRWVWGCMGAEDGDGGDETKLFEDLPSAKKSFKEYKSQRI